MSRLTIGTELRESIDRHALDSFPEECCGVLLGRKCSTDSALAEVYRVLPATNTDPGPRTRRYTIAPETLLEAHKEARRRGEEVLGYYHSHPDHPAEPSEWDRSTAGSGASYLIVSVDGERVTEHRCWRLRSDGSRFDEEFLADD